ncbi:MAG: heavy-metal-associated domain-containing protein [Pseudomonadota bacterium]
MRIALIVSLATMLMASTAFADTIKVSVNGLVCSFCATGIEKTFHAQPAVEKVKVDLDSKLVTIDTKPKQAMDDATITKLITDAGYTVTHIARQ